MFSNKEKWHLPILVVVIILMNVIIFKDFIFKDNLFLYQDIGTDTVNSYYPYYLNFLRAFKNGDLSFWFNNLGMGNNILSMGELISDPFAIVLLAFGEKYLIQGLMVKVILNIICAGIFFYLYMGCFSVSKRAKIVGTLLYCFNGYIILWGQHYQFATIITFIPFLAQGYETLLKKEKGIMLSIAVFLIALYSAYFLYMASLFLFIYAIVRYMDCGERNIQAFLKHFFKSMLCYILGLGLSAVIFLPSVWVMMSSPRVGGHVSDFPLFKLNDLLYYITTILRLFNYNSLGPGDTYYGYANYYEAPILYSGVLTLLMIPFFFKGIEKRRKKIYGALIILFIMFLILPHFAAMFNAYSNIAYRWTFMINFLMIIAATKGMDKYEKEGSFKMILVIGVSIVALILGILLCGNFLSITIRYHKWLFIRYLLRPIGFLSLYIVILGFYKSEKLRKYAKVSLIFAVGFEMIMSSQMAVFKNRVVENSTFYSDKSGYSDYTKEAIALIKNQDKEVFRVEKNYTSQFFNDNLVQDYYGIKSYNSINNNSTLEFISKMEIPIYIHINFIKDFYNRHNLEEIVGVKYYLAKGNFGTPKGYVFLDKVGDVSIYKNEHYLPIGYTYDKYISEEKFLKLSKEEKDIAVLKALVIDSNEESMKIRELENSFAKKDDYFNDISKLSSNSLKLTKFQNGHIEGNIEVEGEDKTLFISIPYDKGWIAKVDGKEKKIIKANIGFMALNLEKGHHSIELDYKQPLLNEGIIASIVSLILAALLRYRRVI